MTPRLFAYLLFAAFPFSCVDSVEAQPKTPPKDAKVDKLAGFTKKTIAGFTVFLHEDVFEGEKGSKITATEALEMELKNIVNLMPKKFVDTLQAKVPLWVNWRIEETLGNGRTGNAAGFYTGVYPRPIKVEGKDVYVSGIRILLMNSVVRSYERSRDAEPSTLILHEFAHAVHHLSIGYENAPIKDAFRQAMERKLYDTKLYMTTNEKEFFAELSCSYLLRLHHFPHNRDELKKHDPAMWKLLESTWGKKGEPAKVGPSTTASKFDLETIDLAKFKCGDQLLGEKIDPSTTNGRPLVLYFWSPRVEGVVFLLELDPFVSRGGKGRFSDGVVLLSKAI